MHQDMFTGSTDGAQPHECEEKSTSGLLVSLLLAPGNWTVQLKTARSYPESQQLSQISGEPETSLFLLSAEVITGLLMIDLKPAAALKAD